MASNDGMSPLHFSLHCFLFHKDEDWAAFVNEPQTAGELEALRSSVSRGCLFGEDQRRDDMVRELELESTMRERGRPSRRTMLETARMPL